MPCFRARQVGSDRSGERETDKAVYMWMEPQSSRVTLWLFVHLDSNIDAPEPESVEN